MPRPVAVSKAEVLRKVSVNVERWLEKAIPAINDRLRRFSAGTPNITVDDRVGDFEYLSNLDQVRAVAEIKAIYNASGWIVIFENTEDGNEGWFKFS